MSDVARYLERVINASAKPQCQIAREVGFRNANVVSMIKTGRTRVPLARIKTLAMVLGLDPEDLLRRCMEEYHPDIWVVFTAIFDKTNHKNIQ